MHFAERLVVKVTVVDHLMDGWVISKRKYLI